MNVLEPDFSTSSALNSLPEKQKKVLILAHNHPWLFPGGAEILAYDLFKAIRSETDYEPFFIGAATPNVKQFHTDTSFQAVVDAPDEMVLEGEPFDYFYQSRPTHKFKDLYQDFKKFLEQFQPDIIHLHHTMRIGLEAIHVARATLPNVKIVYTLHEFILMCHNNGQMIRVQNDELCHRASPERCHQCFPDISPQQFKMREVFIKEHLQLVDQLISPSHFLAKRFINWGIPESKMSVLENGRHLSEAAPFRELPKGKTRNVFGYFGQINPYKGVVLLLEAVDYLVKQNFRNFQLEIFGNIGAGGQNFQDTFWKLVNRYQDNVRYHGRYQGEEMPSLLEGIDWVIMPSIWWENSPLIIPEVFMHKRPMICSNIGGMAEKVDDHVTGLHFRARDKVSLAKTIQQASSDIELWERLVNNIESPLSIENCARQHVALYDSLLD